MGLGALFALLQRLIRGVWKGRMSVLWGGTLGLGVGLEFGQVIEKDLLASVLQA